MSTKLASKAAKHSAQGHGKKGDTPDSHTGRGGASPTGSLASEAGEGAGGNVATHPLDEVLTGNEIQALRITKEKLQKLHHPTQLPTSHPPIQTTSKRVMVKRAKVSEDKQLRKKRVAVLHPMPAGVSPQATRTLQLGQRLKRGDLSPHPVLGNIGENAAATQKEEVSHTASTSHQPPQHILSYQDTIVPRETHALRYWGEAMDDRKFQQDYLSRKLKKSPERLAMNQGDGYRPKQEERIQIDRAIPPLDYGKGYRVGSEFWSQSIPIGNVQTGINTTLSHSERGQPLPLELIGTPNTIRVEKGMPSAEQTVSLCHMWQTTPYLSSRTQQLHSSITDAAPDIKPDMEELAVMGHTPHHLPGVPHELGRLDSLGEEESYSEDSLSGSEAPSPDQARDLTRDMLSHPLVGPALKIRGHLLQWEGAPTHDLQTSKTGSEPVDFRVTFESGVEEEVTSCLLMENCGTAAIYYSWKHLVQPNPLQTVQAGGVQRFYFDTRGGVLLPGQEFSFPFVFKSSGAGIFTEAWALQTCPMLAGGQLVRVTLRGVAFREDVNKQKREDLERELNHRVAVVAADRLINQIVNSISTPPHGSPQLPDTIPEEHVFRSKNPHLYYHYNVVLQLKALYDETLRPELVEDDHPPPSAESGPTPTPSKKEKGKPGTAGAGKKEKEKGGAGGQDKKAKTAKVEGAEVEEAHEPPKPVEKSIPDWDLSTDSLLQVVLGIEEDEKREEKLKLLSDLLGQLSFPPPSLPPISTYTLVYQLVSEAVEQISASSQHLCKVMGLPQRESCPVKSSLSTTEDEQLPSTASSSALSSKKDKEKEKKGKKSDAKKGGAGKDKDRAPSRGKGVAARKSKTSVSSKDTDVASEIQAEQPPTAQPVQQVNPVVEKNYKDNFYATVYAILVDTVDRMVSVLPE